ncbi:hypothetical protein CO614_06055 [Lysobacteraceae bacterium NML120232]|nr:hypothetical protein CO608_07975 [Xanthomonadaceae bacterium NML08-0793]PJK12087.1 hypothetical protein CO614_06055 [Xanthomonadaceae bacterium NML120232]
MMTLYPQIKSVHMHLAMLSGFLFLIRGGAAVLFNARWPRHALWRYASYSIDTCLLAAALVLLFALYRAGAVAAGFFANGWLALKLLLLVVYVLLGVFAMRPKLGRAGRMVCYVAALGVFVCIYNIARAHHPLGGLLS